VRWGVENLDINAGRLKALGFNTMLPPIKLSCTDHGGSGLVRFQQWTGTEWKAVSDWISGDRPMVRQMIEDSAAKYAAEKGIKPGCLGG
jgi:branched-chain amino acid transport system substrate-binding protein